MNVKNLPWNWKNFVGLYNSRRCLDGDLKDRALLNLFFKTISQNLTIKTFPITNYSVTDSIRLFKLHDIIRTSLWHSVHWKPRYCAEMPENCISHEEQIFKFCFKLGKSFTWMKFRQYVSEGWIFHWLIGGPNRRCCFKKFRFPWDTPYEKVWNLAYFFV